MVRDRMERRAGFTLVELLVVIGIIALLVGILLPALGAARRASQASACLANLHDMCSAMLTYSNDNQGYYPPFIGSGSITYAVNANGYTNVAITPYWFGGWYGTGAPINGGYYYGGASPLSAYWGRASIDGCPAFGDLDANFRPGYGPCDYAYNTLIGHQSAAAIPNPPAGYMLHGEKAARIKNAAVKAVLWDSARYSRGSPSTLNNGLDRTPFGYPSSGNIGQPDPNFHGRHANGMGNVLWADGHAEATPVCYFDYNALGFGNMELAKLKGGNVGVIDADGVFTTNDNYDPAY